MSALLEASFESSNVYRGSDRFVVLDVSLRRVGRCVLHCALLLVKTKQIATNSKRAEGDAGLLVQR